jgi:hypothetical protein
MERAWQQYLEDEDEDEDEMKVGWSVSQRLGHASVTPSPLQ